MSVLFEFISYSQKIETVFRSILWIHRLQAEIYNGNSEISNLDLFPQVDVEDDAVRSKQELCNVLQKEGWKCN